MLVVPTALMDLLRTVIAVFHTDRDGNVRDGARLVPGLTREDAAGQAGLRAALHAAASQAQVRITDDADADEIFSVTPHDMRRTVISELGWKNVEELHRKRWAGHAAGDDVHHRAYMLDDPLLRPGTEIAALIDRTVVDELPGGLLIATLLRCTTGSQPALAPDAARIDTELTERGWLIRSDAHGEPLLTAAEVARELHIEAQAARRWLADGTLPSVVWKTRARGVERRATLSDVLAYKRRAATQITLSGLAEETRTTYHTLYQFVVAKSIVLERSGARGYLVPADIADRIRAHFAAQAALHARSVPMSVAAETLNTTLPTVHALIRDGSLTEDSRAHNGARMITRASLEHASATRRAPTRATRTRWLV